MLKKIFTLLVIVFSTLHLPLFAGETIRILAIGNSFSEDAVENYLYNLGQADDVTFVIGNMYIGGCSLETHWSNASNDASAYSYRKIDASGTKTTTADYKLSQAIVDESWDYITFQQVSQNSGQYATYFPYLTNLKSYVEGLATNPNVKFALHATWAYAQNTSHSGFANYGSDQMTMYNAIVSAANSVATTAGISIVIPSGTAIQNARTSFLGDNLCRDGYHLDLGVGRYTASCTWYEKITGKTVVGNTYAPSGLTASYIEVAQSAAHNAVLTPNAVTDLSDGDDPILDPNTFFTSAAINIDFGAGTTLSADPWNNFTSFSLGASLIGLQDMDGKSTPFKLELTTAFGGVNPDGPTAGLSLDGWVMPQGATRDSFYGSGGKVSSFLLSNLNPNEAYNFSMLASRLYVSDNRETYIEVEGITTEKVTVNSTANATALATVHSVKPKANGTIIIRVGAGANNNNASKFFYINALQIMMEHVNDPLPDPNTFVLTEPVNINCGTGVSTSTKFWNNLSSVTSGTSAEALKGENGEQTPFKIEIVDRFGDFNTNGSPTALEIDGWSIPQEVTKDSFWGNAGAAFSGMNIVTGSFLLSNLNTTKSYDFSMLASRLYVADNRDTYIEAEGLATKRASINSSANTTNLAVVDNIQPKSNGTIKLTIGAGESNNNVNKFFYINALQIKPHDVSTSIDTEVENDRKISLSSNLVVNILELRDLDNDCVYDYSVIRMDGQIVKNGRLFDTNDTIEIDSLEASYYILVLRNTTHLGDVRLPFVKKNY